MERETNKRDSSGRARPRLRSKPGSDPQGKQIIVYLLWHTDQSGDEKLIGVYEKHSNASSAIKRVKDKPGFSEKGGTFEIVSYELNKDYWTEGFVRREGFSLPAWFRPT